MGMILVKIGSSNYICVFEKSGWVSVIGLTHQIVMKNTTKLGIDVYVGHRVQISYDGFVPKVFIAASTVDTIVVVNIFDIIPIDCYLMDLIFGYIKEVENQYELVIPFSLSELIYAFTLTV